jgi:ATP-dependent RNA helicase DeaD
MAGGDVVGQSQTGSGKTAAFAIPAIEKVDTRQRGVQVLILCPTRELRSRFPRRFTSSRSSSMVCTRCRSTADNPSTGNSRAEAGCQHCDWNAGTRHGSHAARHAEIDSLKIVILDEVDVMLNMGFRDDIEIILQAAPSERQTVFFSATIPRPIQQLIEKYSRNPQQVRIEQKALTVPTVEQIYYEVDRNYKIELLTRLIDIHDLKLGIIFCNTKRMVDDLVDHLNAQGYSADRLHGDMTQLMRDRVMNKFRKSGLEFLVATDVAARGIDVDDVQVVFNYDLPYDVEDYLHRIGRTGRPAAADVQYPLSPGARCFRSTTSNGSRRSGFSAANRQRWGQVEEARAILFLDKLRTTLKTGEFKKQDHLEERLLEEGFSSTDIASALMHQLQGGDAAAASKKVPREREPERDIREERPRSAPRPAMRPAMLKDMEPRTPWKKEGSVRREEVPARPRPAMLPKQPEVVRVAAPVPEPVPEPVRETVSHVVTARPAGKLKKSRGRPSSRLVFG